ncbi:outer membrane beta-barrel protein [Methylocystis sp. JR02]|uniref:outer membrane protein n=1 Tax=Methylocystis sp. JR02 TaxID=3046284 RepID=UPI0024BBC70A|nr:outer membrane beta-barrel protein [Methylocystis sp. JR02]MDJ0450227.1 outer membrane beta-barrel protein [Methylocystis sp. JR02]
MHKIALSALALTMTVGSALAADLPSRKGPPVLPPPPPPPLWTGFYVGLNAGGTWSNSNNITYASFPGGCNVGFPGCAAFPNSSQLLAAVSTGNINNGNQGGFIGGGQIGYNWQFYNSFVVGVEADIQGVAASRRNAISSAALQNPSFTNLLVQTTSVSRSLDYIGTVRGRLGWLATPTLLIYGTGGLAYGGVSLNYGSVGTELRDASLPNSYFSAATFSDTRVGWTAGGGVEWMFWPNWSAKVEYLYYDLGSVTVAGSPLVNIGGPASAVPGGTYSSAFPQVTTRFNGNIVRAGLNYHFNWGAPAPVVAKY